MRNSAIHPNNDCGKSKRYKKNPRFCQNDCPINTEIAYRGKPAPIDEYARCRAEGDQTRADRDDNNDSEPEAIRQDSPRWRGTYDMT